MNIIGLYGAIDWDANIFLKKINEETAWTTWIHDSGATLLKDGKHICSILEERLTRFKNEGNFPDKSIDYCLECGNLSKNDIDLVVFATGACLYFSEKSTPQKLEKKIKSIFPNAKLEIISHHTSHAMSSIMSSDFDEGIVIVNDGSGSNLFSNDERKHTEMDSNGFFKKSEKILNMTNTINGFNEYSGFHGATSYLIYCKKMKKIYPTSDPKYIGTWDGKVMGLSAYGKEQDLTLKCNKYYDILCRDIGSLPLISFIDNKIWEFKTRDKTPEDAAWLLQKNFENAVSEYLTILKERKYLKENVCFAGGSYLNVLSNSKIKKSNIANIHIPPFTNDSGQSFGAASYGAFKYEGGIEMPHNISLLGKEYSNEEILSVLQDNDKCLLYEKYDFGELCQIVSEKLKENQIIGWFQNRSEYGPRALCARSILMNPSHKENKDILNLKVKHREYWRPFAGVILEEYVDDYFEDGFISPYMLYSMTVREDKLNVIPAITHVDKTCRPQTVNRRYNPQITELLESFNRLVGIPVLLNTSFNDNGEPIVESPKDAIDSFIKMNMDCLAIGNYVVTKRDRV